MKSSRRGFSTGIARANRQKPSGIAAKETILNTHLIPLLGHKKLDAITTERVQQLKHSLKDRAPKTVNNVLTVLNVLLKKAVEWDVIERMPCIIRLLPIPKPSAGFYDFDEYERLVTAAKADRTAYLIVLLGGEAGLRCGEMMALEWTDVDLAKRQLCVQRSDWARDAAPAAAVSHFGQLERAQKSVGASVVGPSSPPEFPFRADEQFVAQSDRVLVPGGYARADPARHVYQRADAGTSDQRAVRHYNQQPKPFVWTKDADTILAKIDRCKEAPNAPDEENVKLGVPWCVEPP